MTVLDHLGIGVADYERSKAFYEQALAPLGYTLMLEFSGAAAGFGKDDGGGPSFFIEAHGEPARGRLHIAFAAHSRDDVDAFHAAGLEAGGTDNGAPGVRWYHDDYYGGYVLDPEGLRPFATLPTGDVRPRQPGFGNYTQGDAGTRPDSRPSAPEQGRRPDARDERLLRCLPDLRNHERPNRRHGCALLVRAQGASSR